MHPINPALDGQDVSNKLDSKGKPFFAEMAKVAKDDGQGFVNYFWSKPGKQGDFPKLSFVKLFKPWGWVVGMGVYVDNIDAAIAAKQADLDDRIFNMILLVLGIALGLAVLGVAAGVLSALSVTRTLGGEPSDIAGNGRAGVRRGPDHGQGRRPRSGRAQVHAPHGRPAARRGRGGAVCHGQCGRGQRGALGLVRDPVPGHRGTGRLHRGGLLVPGRDRGLHPQERGQRGKDQRHRGPDQP